MTARANASYSSLSATRLPPLALTCDHGGANSEVPRLAAAEQPRAMRRAAANTARVPPRGHPGLFSSPADGGGSSPSSLSASVLARLRVASNQSASLTSGSSSVSVSAATYSNGQFRRLAASRRRDDPFPSSSRPRRKNSSSLSPGESESSSSSSSTSVERSIASTPRSTCLRRVAGINPLDARTNCSLRASTPSALACSRKPGQSPASASRPSNVSLLSEDDSDMTVCCLRNARTSSQRRDAR